MSIKTYWYKRENQGNFGDELGPWIVAKLSGKRIEYVPLVYMENSKLSSIKSLLKKLFKGSYKIKNIHKTYEWISIFNKDVLITVGSIISWYTYRNVVVWGAGIINSNDSVVNSKFFAVRGRYTLEKIQKLGCKGPVVLGDPGLLLALIHKVKCNKEFVVGVIPHIFHFDFLKENLKHEKIKIINLLDSVEKVANDINLCDYTFSTSLHGLIVSHSYEIPSLWIDIKECVYKLNGDNIKFRDYFSSVDMREYEPIVLSISDLQNVDDLLRLILQDYKGCSLPLREQVRQIQCSLLRCAPFFVKAEYSVQNLLIK